MVVPCVVTFASPVHPYLYSPCLVDAGPQALCVPKIEYSIPAHVEGTAAPKCPTRHETSAF